MISDEIHPHVFSYFDGRGHVYNQSVYVHAHVHVEEEFHFHEYLNAAERLEGLPPFTPDVFRGPLPSQRSS